ncbi:MAG TPA: LuxR C-terminal-related transcriptional regulator, partial [Candidatus Elarobacter sp.]|nr:LuxR C-terminal-related transcriptional regulator [Candidatus Elarobacter sp.]
HTWRARDVEHAIGWNERAGDHAHALFAHADAARHYARACELAGDRLQHAQLAEKAAEALYATGDVAAAVARVSEAIALAGEADRRRLSLRKAYLLFDQGRYDESLEEARRVVAELGDEDSPLRFDAETIAAGLLSARGRPAEALIHLERAEQLSARGQTISSARFAGNFGYALGLLGRTDEARARFAESVREARERNDIDVLVRALNNQGIVELAHGSLGVARTLYADGLELAQSTNNLRFVAWLSQNAAFAALLGGDLAAARQYLARCDAIRHDVGTVSRWALATAMRCATLIADDDPELRATVRATARAAVADGDAAGAACLAGALALDLLHRGLVDEAAGIVAEALPSVTRADPPYWLHDAAGRCAAPKLRAAARATLAAAADLPGAQAARGFLALSDAREALRKRRADARGLAASAVGAFRAAGWRTEEAFALETAGRTAEAVALFRAIGAVAEVRRLTETTGAPRRRGEATLTPREREIASLLAAAGATKDIAAKLTISERTVESHTAAIYRKLGVSTRADLARLLEEAAAPAAR